MYEYYFGRVPNLRKELDFHIPDFSAPMKKRMQTRLLSLGIRRILMFIGPSGMVKYDPEGVAFLPVKQIL